MCDMTKDQELLIWIVVGIVASALVAYFTIFLEH